MPNSAPIPVAPPNNNTDSSASSPPPPQQFAFSSPRQFFPDTRFSPPSTGPSSPENTLSQSFQSPSGSLPNSYGSGSLSDQLSRSVSANNSFGRHRRRSTLGDLFGIAGNNSASSSVSASNTNTVSTSATSAASPNTSPTFPGLPLGGTLSTSPSSSEFSTCGPETPPSSTSLPHTSSLPPLKTDYPFFNAPPGVPDSAAKDQQHSQHHRRSSWAAPSSPIFSGNGILSWLSSSPVKAKDASATPTNATGEMDVRRRASDQPSAAFLGRLSQPDTTSTEQQQPIQDRGRDNRRRPSNIRRLSPMAERMIRGHYGDN